jgi:glycosyltransferase involved in cell wall biosynthesis
MVTVVVPAYREEEHVEATLRGVAENLRAAELTSEIIVVLDLVPGDRTASHVRKVAETYSEICVLERKGRRGVGEAVRAGIKESRGEVVIITIADQSENPSDVVRLVNAAKDYDLVFTNGFKHGRLGRPLLVWGMATGKILAIFGSDM